MTARRLALAVSLCAALSPFTAIHAADAPLAPQHYGTWGVDLTAMDRSVKPGDDFFRYVNGNWAAKTQIPADKTRIGSFDALRDLSDDRVHAILEKWAADKNLKPGSDEAKVAAIYRTYLDEARVEKLDAKPIEPLLEAVRNAKTKNEIVALMAHGRRSFGGSFFALGINDDAKNPEKYALHLSQAGLGLPDREYYLSEKFNPQKERYQTYVAGILRLAGWPEPETNAAGIVAMETRIAEAHWSRSQGRDRDKTYNPMTVAELEKNAPGFPWAVYFEDAGVEKADRAIVRQNTVLPKEAKIFEDTPVATLQAWEAFHIVDQSAPLLSKRFADAQWEFRSKFLNGVTEQRPRWKRAVAMAEAAMGEAIGRAYVAEYFPPESKAKMEQLVANLRLAMKGRIENLQWMGADTKAKALEKLAKFNVKIGYPSKWRDYSNLQPVEGDLVGDAMRVSKFEWDRQISRIGQKVDVDEWGMTPQTVNAYYSSSRNEIVFPAAILQPPFFDPKADMAVNFGGIGGVIGHEITHGFDDQGRKSDGNGVLRDWWAVDDANKFEVQASRLGAQYESYVFPQLPGLHIIGRQTMGENIGDLGGILMALDAYHLSLKGQAAPVLDGFTADQRVFLGWAQVWRTLTRDGALRQQLTTDAHSPGNIRAIAPLRNVDAWYAAFGVKEGDANYVKPENRVRIW